MADDASMIAGLGHNSPPVESPFEAVKVHVDDLMDKARAWLSGAPVETQEQANGVSALLDELRKAKTATDNARKVEAKPHDDGKAEVQARYRPLLENTDRAADICKKALAPFLMAQEAAREAAAREARRIADEKDAAAREAALEAAFGSLEEREAADAAQRAAKAATRDAKALETGRSHATGGARATTLRTYYVPKLVDLRAAAEWIWDQHKPEFEEFVLSIARQRVAGGLRKLPGFEITEERRAV